MGSRVVYDSEDLGVIPPDDHRSADAGMDSAQSCLRVSDVSRHPRSDRRRRRRCRVPNHVGARFPVVRPGPAQHRAAVEVHARNQGRATGKVSESHYGHAWRKCEEGIDQVRRAGENIRVQMQEGREWTDRSSRASTDDTDDLDSGPAAMYSYGYHRLPDVGCAWRNHRAGDAHPRWADPS